jgi:hypothetical protein
MTLHFRWLSTSDGSLPTPALRAPQRDLFAAKLAKVGSMDRWTQHSKHFSPEKKAELARLGNDYDKCIQATKDRARVRVRVRVRVPNPNPNPNPNPDPNPDPNPNPNP